MDLPDEELLRAWCAGDVRAGNELVDRHARSLLRFFRRRSDDGAEDLAQRTFLEAHRLRERLRDGASFRAFLFGVARNVLLRHRRELARRMQENEVRLDRDPVTTPSRSLQLRQEQRVLLQALRTLPLDLQITIELYYWEQLKVREIAEVLDVAAGTIKWRLSRAREQLEAQIAASEASVRVRDDTISNLEAWARSLREPAESGPVEP